MDVAKIIKEQRDLILQKYGFQIKVEKIVEDNNDGYYEYTISTRKDGGFVATIKRKNKDELDSLLNITFYMDSVPYKVSYARAEAYDDCVQTSPYPYYKLYLTNYPIRLCSFFLLLQQSHHPFWLLLCIDNN